jgi:hypothetical protein
MLSWIMPTWTARESHGLTTTTIVSGSCSSGMVTTIPHAQKLQREIRPVPRPVTDTPGLRPSLRSDNALLGELTAAPASDWPFSGSPTIRAANREFVQSMTVR